MTEHDVLFGIYVQPPGRDRVRAEGRRLESEAGHVLASYQRDCNPGTVVSIHRETWKGMELVAVDEKAIAEVTA